MSVKNRLLDWICQQRHLVILMDPFDAGHTLDGSIVFRCFSALWYYRNGPTLYCKTEDWAFLFDILLCLMPVHENANDDHRGGHLDYSWASLSCLFLSGLLSLHLFSNPHSLRLLSLMMEGWSEWCRASKHVRVKAKLDCLCMCVQHFCPRLVWVWPLGCTLQSVILSGPPVWAVAPPAFSKSSSHLSVLDLPTAPHCSQGEPPSAASMLLPSFTCALLASAQALLLTRPHKRVWML